ncbi:leucine-rich repeat protein lrrA-like isoform X1 [Venturia canescens]|uniref:leucine-rich repeat protein lrrA-like isoform X1 n=1 Tax=Venturia canescens TaxID=32260 RepID=UPI001C9BF067|nr:leucine-rich repeat protein lrrA-like isoform X1 [Venturia canescens]
MEGEWPLNYPLDYAFANEDEIPKYVEMSVPTKVCSLEEHHVSKLLSNINYNTVRDLVLSAKKLNDLPEDFGFHLVNLTRLDLSKNDLTTVPHSLKFIWNLRYLFLNNNHIQYLPPTIAEITSLTELNLSNNSMTSLPESIANLSFLEVLNLAYNYLSKLPPACQKLHNLKILDLTGNRLKQTPHCIVTGMTGLQVLHLSENLNIDLTQSPASEKLVALYVKNAGKYVKFPTWILTGNAPRLEILQLDGTMFDPFEFPKECSNLKIHNLSIQNCCVYGLQLDKLLGLLKELAVLKAANRKKVKRCNDYWHLPTEQLEFPEKMVEMDLSFTKLSYISENIEHFVNLVELDLHDNALRWLPDEICKLPELKILNVADNSLLGLPNDFGNLSSLTEFQASKNKIPALPHSTKKLKNLAYLDLYGNAFTRVPKTLKFMVKLQGLDIDYNPVFISNLQINGIRYETLRKTLHKKYLHLGCWRDSGARYDTDYDETSETDSEISTTDSHEYHTGATEKLNNKIEENWDISDNSADEYDPTCDQGYPTRKRLPNFYYGVAHNLYCPSALHALPIRQQIIQLKEQGLFQEYAETEVEGQFEDA